MLPALQAIFTVWACKIRTLNKDLVNISENADFLCVNDRVISGERWTHTEMWDVTPADALLLTALSAHKVIDYVQ